MFQTFIYMITAYYYFILFHLHTATIYLIHFILVHFLPSSNLQIFFDYIQGRILSIPPTLHTHHSELFLLR